MVVYSRGARLTTPRARGSHPPRPRTLLPHRHPTSPSNKPLSFAQQRTLAHTHERGVHCRRRSRVRRGRSQWRHPKRPLDLSPPALPPCYRRALVAVSCHTQSRSSASPPWVCFFCCRMPTLAVRRSALSLTRSMRCVRVNTALALCCPAGRQRSKGGSQPLSARARLHGVTRR